MALSIPQQERLTKDSQEFHALDTVRDSEERKRRVRLLELDVQTDLISPSTEQIQGFLHSELELPRILVYLLFENAKINSNGLARSQVLAEWERLRRADLAHDVSRMPLYYSARAYLELVRNSPALRERAGDDCTLMREIDSRLARSEIDRESQLRERMAELLSLACGDHSTANPTISAARIQRSGALLGALIGAAALIAVALVGYCEKRRGAHVNQPSSLSQPRR